MEEKITYFEQPGDENTEKTFQLVIERAKARGIRKVVLASTRGETAKLPAERFAGSGVKLIVVPYQYGFRDANPFPQELVPELEKKGCRVHFGTMLFHTENLYGTITPAVLATLLRTFCQGMKVCVEITMMATDGGGLALGEKVIAVAGTGKGADTAVVITAASSNRLNELHIREIICKPLETKSWLPGARPAPTDTAKPQ
jgi:uncharacterized protein